MSCQYTRAFSSALLSLPTLSPPSPVLQLELLECNGKTLRMPLSLQLTQIPIVFNHCPARRSPGHTLARIPPCDPCSRTQAHICSPAPAFSRCGTYLVLCPTVNKHYNVTLQEAPLVDLFHNLTSSGYCISSYEFESSVCTLWHSPPSLLLQCRGTGRGALMMLGQMAFSSSCAELSGTQSLRG
ncbi:hypothetical protein WMY93_018157 [Mugilogobius chulae]|uniref:FZ domain-containing protein n=1 Tax=Mugilogobius chulae TaxID=88201 RepID=A0AAW0NKS6_9GOBI